MHRQKKYNEMAIRGRASDLASRFDVMMPHAYVHFQSFDAFFNFWAHNDHQNQEENSSGYDGMTISAYR